MESTGVSAESARDLLGRAQDAYEQHRFQDAFRATSHLWVPSIDISQLSIEELVLGGRLAARLGGSRLSRSLLRAAHQRDPRNPLVRYFTQHLRIRGRHLFDELREFEIEPDLGGDDVVLRASWFGYYGRVWARLRDFPRALECIEKAHHLNADKVWVLSCESDVLGTMDRWEDALRCAEQAWELGPGAPYAAESLALALLNLGRVNESAERMARATENTQSYEVAQIACWHQCAFAETLEGAERDHLLARARSIAARMVELAPLADRDTRAQFARAHLDIADLADDHAEMERWSKDVRSPFYRKMLANLKRNPTGTRIRLPFRRSIQKYAECVPTSIASAAAANGVNISVEKLAAEVTFGGTAEWAAAEWLRKRGLHVRFFAVTEELARLLIKSGIAFTVVWDDDESGHAVAVVGLDEAAGTAIVHDPLSFRSTEYLLSSFTKDYSPLGMTGMAVVAPERAHEIDALLPPESDIVASGQEHLRALHLLGPAAARPIVEEISKRFPSHPGIRYLRAVQAVDDGRTGEALGHLRELMREFPSSAIVRYRLLNACRSLGNTALMRETLSSIVETGTVPGVQSRQEWVQPHQRYIYEYADLLRFSSATRNRAKALLHSLITKRWVSAGAWHTLADLYWTVQEKDAALLAYRVAAALSESNEHFARAYADTLCRCGQREKAFESLERRVKAYGSSRFAVGTWVTWINALEDWGEPEKALSACSTALQRHGAVPELLVFVIPFLARMGDWSGAERELRNLQTSESQGAFHEAAVYFHRMRGEVEQALHHAEAWVSHVPRSIPARYALLDLIDRSSGPDAAAEKAAEWMRQHPANEDYEEAFCQHVSGDTWRKLRVLLRRLKRNSEDGWAWRELAFASLSNYESADARQRRRLEPRIDRLLAECDRTAAGDAATLRAHALWLEDKGDWKGAVSGYLEAIRREPENFFAYRRLWDCSSRLTEDERRRLWQEIEPFFLQFPGHLPNARDMAALLSERFGVRDAEVSVAGWLQQRPDDPNVVEARADLLIEHGHGHSDAERALDMLKAAVERFPYHAGLRFSLANAYRGVGDHAAATEVFRELVQRQPDNTSALLQLAWVQHHEDDFAGAAHTLDQAAACEPQNANIIDTRAQMLMQQNRFDDARHVVEAGLQSLPKNVRMRERAVAILCQCGFYEQAVAVARQGIVVYPYGGYMWLLLGRLLVDAPQFAEQGDVEACLRRSLELNRSLFETADLLARVLVDQRRYDQAAKVMSDIEGRLADPSPARGRSAWIKRQQGLRREALNDLATTVKAAPWYAWGWNLLTDWLQEDEEWGTAREMLGVVPPQMLTNVSLRLERLLILEKAGTESTELDKEWKVLLTDFPENVPLHLRRYDSLVERENLDEAAAVIEAILPIATDNVYALARLADLRCRQHKNGEALDAALRVCFAPVEDNVWPANNVWQVLESNNLDVELRRRMRSRLDAGDKPTRRSLVLYATNIMQAHEQKVKQSRIRNWRPERGAREILALLKIVDRNTWGDDYYRADLFGALCDYGYQPLLLRISRRLQRSGPQLNAELWAQIGRAMIGAHRKPKAKKLLRDWRERTGIGMWAVCNYTLCLSRFRKADLREIVVSCRDALAGLPHDYCARYLAYVQAEACALLGDKAGLLDTWENNAAYFEGDPDSSEYFKSEDHHLLGDIPMLVRLLQQNENWLYRKTLWGVRMKRLWRQTVRSEQNTEGQNAGVTELVRWILIVLIWLLIQVLSRRQ